MIRKSRSSNRSNNGYIDSKDKNDENRILQTKAYSFPRSNPFEIRNVRILRVKKQRVSDQDNGNPVQKLVIPKIDKELLSKYEIVTLAETPPIVKIHEHHKGQEKIQVNDANIIGPTKRTKSLSRFVQHVKQALLTPKGRTRKSVDFSTSDDAEISAKEMFPDKRNKENEVNLVNITSVTSTVKKPNVQIFPKNKKK